MIKSAFLFPRTNIVCVQPSRSKMKGEALAKQIETILQSQFGCNVIHFRVRILESGLVLEGIVGTYHGKQLAQHVAKLASGQRITANDIQVR